MELILKKWEEILIENIVGLLRFFTHIFKNKDNYDKLFHKLSTFS